MSTDLTKMVERLRSGVSYFAHSDLNEILTAMAAQIKAKREEIDKLKIRHGEQIDPKGVKG